VVAPQLPAEAAPTQAAPVQAAPVPARASKGTVVLAIGLPGSGKSSWFKRHNIHPLSSDLLRELLFDDAQEQRFQDLVFSNLRSMLKARLIAKRPMNYVDATNLTPQERQHWIKLAKDYNYEVHAVFFDVPLDICVERHQRRDRVVPEDIMRRMAAKLKAPAFEEGFAKITVVRVKKKE
jgi:predicted kinase